MNRKCAAGTGAFLEEIALRLDLPLEKLNGLAEQSTKDVTLGSFCTVFAATEILARSAPATTSRISSRAPSVGRQRISEMDTIDGALVLTAGDRVQSISGDVDTRGLRLPHIGSARPSIRRGAGGRLFAMEKAQKGE